MTKAMLIERLELVISKSVTHHYCELTASVRDWEGYGKNRTYFSIIESSKDTKLSKHYKKADYGYFDNKTNEYVPAKYGDLRKDYTFSGEQF